MESKLTPMTDRELRSMLNSLLLEDVAMKDEENTLSNMEMNIMMHHEPVFAPVHDRSNWLINRLDQDGNKTFNWPWYLLLAILILFAGLFYFNPSRYSIESPENQPEKKLTVLPSTKDSAENSQFIGSSKPKHIEIEQSLSPANEIPLNIIDSNPAVNAEPKLFPSFTETITAYFQPEMKADPEKQFPIDTFFYGIKRVEVNGSYFPVSLVGSYNEHVHIEGEMKVEGTSRVVKKIDIRMEYKRKGETLVVNVVIKREGSWALMSGTINYKGFLRLTLPKNVDVKVDNTSGDIHAQELSGNSVQLNSNYGNITAERIDQGIKTTTTSGDLNLKDIHGQCDLSSQYGNIRIQHVDGNINASCTSGNLVVKDINGELALASSYGNIELSTVKGSASIKATSGNVEVSSLDGKFCNIKSDYGRISADHIIASMVIKATSGDIDLNEITGMIDLHSAYGAQHLDNIHGSVQSKSTSGNIVVKHQTGLLTASATYGDIKVQESSGNYSIAVNSGLLSMRNVQVTDSADLETTYGDIRLALKGGIDGNVFDLETGSGEISFPDSKFMAKEERKKLLTGTGHTKIKGFAQSGNIAVE